MAAPIADPAEARGRLVRFRPQDTYGSYRDEAPAGENRCYERDVFPRSRPRQCRARVEIRDGGGTGRGLVLGVLTNLAQGWLPAPWDQIPNSGAVWSTVAFIAGALLARWASLRVAAVAGLLAEVGLVAGYYGYAEFGRDGMGDLTFPLLWLTLACVAGPLFGVAGVWWRRSRTVRRRVTGLASLAGVFGMEGIDYAWTLHYTSQAWACLAVALLASLLMAAATRSGR
ncbi:DUF6518 family protein (plasmid) [Streptomyces sp. QH1-20]|uniref:DUF6518 family protein n=1 Tax=Streptomyces sp. QH1-20 TaxID=3240934 RepID=UPI0035118FB0